MSRHRIETFQHDQQNSKATKLPNQSQCASPTLMDSPLVWHTIYTLAQTKASLIYALIHLQPMIFMLEGREKCISPTPHIYCQKKCYFSRATSTQWGKQYVLTVYSRCWCQNLNKRNTRDLSCGTTNEFVWRGEERSLEKRKTPHQCTMLS